MDNLFKLSAREVVSLLRRQEISPMDLIDSAEERIKNTDHIINALPTLCFDRARDHARKIMKTSKDDKAPEYLYGLPIAV